jgi:hypothetical protein
MIVKGVFNNEFEALAILFYRMFRVMVNMWDNIQALLTYPDFIQWLIQYCSCISFEALSAFLLQMDSGNVFNISFEALSSFLLQMDSGNGEHVGRFHGSHHLSEADKRPIGDNAPCVYS